MVAATTMVGTDIAIATAIITEGKETTAEMIEVSVANDIIVVLDPRMAMVVGDGEENIHMVMMVVQAHHRPTRCPWGKRRRRLG